MVNPARFEKEYRLLHLPLCMYALRLTGDVDMAGDIVEEAFARVWEMVRAGEGPDNLKAYLYTAVRNKALTSLKECGRFEAMPETYEVSEDDVDTSERDARLWKALDSLPEKCRRVFLLSKRDSLTNAEVAEELGISVKTVENQITRAYRLLRAAYRKPKRRKI